MRSFNVLRQNTNIFHQICRIIVTNRSSVLYSPEDDELFCTFFITTSFGFF